MVTLEQGGTAPDLFTHPRAVLVDRRGNVIVARGREGPPATYDARGKFIKIIGRVGEGPGEYRSAETLVLGEADTLYILDRALNRFSVLSPGWEYIRSAPIVDGTFSAAWTTTGNLVVSAEVHDRARFGKPYHVLDRVGNYVRSFGETGEAIIPGKSLPLVRFVAPSAGGGFWSVTSSHRYQLERWTSDGKRELSLNRQSKWFPKTPADRKTMSFTKDAPSLPFVVSIAEDRNGRVWTNVRVSDAEWRKAVRWDEKAKGELALRPIVDDLDQAFDTIFEVFDGRTGALLVSQRFDEAWFPFAAGDRTVRFRVDENGHTSLQIYRAVIQAR